MSLVVNNAGGAHGLDRVGDLQDIDIDTMVSTNVLGLISLTQLLVKGPLYPTFACLICLPALTPLPHLIRLQSPQRGSHHQHWLDRRKRTVRGRKRVLRVQGCCARLHGLPPARACRYVHPSDRDPAWCANRPSSSRSCPPLSLTYPTRQVWWRLNSPSFAFVETRPQRTRCTMASSRVCDFFFVVSPTIARSRTSTSEG